MVLEQIADKVFDTDVLIIGGGIAGCTSAAKASEQGLKVLLAEKAKTDRSGSAGQGIDHYGIFPREGVTPLDLVKHWQHSLRVVNGEGRWADPNIMFRYYDNAFWTLEELEKLGIPMRWDDGEFYWMPHRGPGMDPRISLKLGLRVHWQNIKPLLAKAMRKKIVHILERTMIVDLLTNKGRVVGATAVDTRTGEFIVIKAKAVVIATGLFARCYDPETPHFWKYKFRYHWCPATISGDGWAIAYRAGAELASMDITGWGFRIRDDLNISFGNFPINDGVPSRPLDWTGEEVSYGTWQSASGYNKLHQDARTPIYHSLEHLPDDFHKRMEVAFADERMVSFKIAENRGFNPRTHWYELMLNKPHNFVNVAGVYADEDLKATLPGLYAVGDCVAGLHSCGEAAFTGFFTGKSLPAFISSAAEPVVDKAQVESQKQAALAPLNIKDGTEPMELESAIRYICDRYVSQFKSEGKLREGLRRLDSLRRVFLPKLMAKNPHYLMRCLEVRNIMDLTELHIQACLQRRETRGAHIRLDFPQQDRTWDNMLTYQRLESGRPILEMREPPDLKPEYARGGK